MHKGTGIILRYRGKDLPVRKHVGTGFLSATDLAEIFNRRVDKFMGLQSVKMILKKNVNYISSRGKYGGTFLSRELFYLMVRWCKGEDIYCRIRFEHKFGEMLQEVIGESFNIYPQHKVGGYFVDWYIEGVNVCVEYDELHHSTQKQADRKREQHIKKRLNCEFVRVKQGEELKGMKEILKRCFRKAYEYGCSSE